GHLIKPSPFTFLPCLSPTPSASLPPSKQPTPHSTDSPMNQPKHPSTPEQTHTVFNQAKDLVDYNSYDGDTALKEAVERHGGGWAHKELHAYGEVSGRADIIQSGYDANAHLPVLQTHDRHGRRVDTIDYHPSYHENMARGL